MSEDAIHRQAPCSREWYTPLTRRARVLKRSRRGRSRELQEDDGLRSILARVSGIRSDPNRELLPGRLRRSALRHADPAVGNGGPQGLHERRALTSW